MAYTGTSIVDYLASIGQASDYNTRASLASRMGISNYSGTASQNTQLLNMLRSSSPTAAQTAPQTYTQQAAQPITQTNNIQQTVQPVAQPVSQNWNLSRWNSTGGGTWSSQPVLTINGQQFQYNTPQEYISHLQQLQAQGLTGNISRYISEFQSVIPEFTRSSNNSVSVPQQTASPQQNTTSQSSYTGPSIVDYLSSIGQSSDYNTRATLAAQMGIPNYTGTAAQNTQLLTAMRSSNVGTSTGNRQQAIEYLTSLGYVNPDETEIQSAMIEVSGGTPQYTGNSSQPIVNLKNLVETANGYIDSTTNQFYTKEDVVTQVANDIAPGLVASGITVNPDVLKLTSFEDFMTQAGDRVNPYYKSMYESTKNLVSTKLTQLSQDLGLKTDELNRTSDNNIRTGRETLAERGLSFSGQRQTFDTESQQSLNRNLDLANTSAFRSGQDILTQAESQIGTSNLQGINTNLGGRNLQFGNNITGSAPYQQYTDTYNTAQGMSNDKNRKLQYAYNLNNTSF